MSLEQIKIDVTQYRDRVVAYLDAWAVLFAPIVDAIARFEPRITCDGTSLDVAITGDKHALQAVWGILRRNNFRLANELSDRPKPNEPNYSQFFYLNGTYEGNNPKIWLNFSSTVCRRVKTGTKMIEQDVYETVCGEQDLPHSAGSAP